MNTESKNMQNRKNKSNGFTLIELLVVISIIGLLATLLMANFNATRSRARDAQRKSDLRNIQTALRLYYNDFGEYPDDGADSLEFNGAIEGCGDPVAQSVCDWGTNFELTGRDSYMSILPADPSGDRRYFYQNDSDNDTYTLSACLENQSDDRCNGNCKVGHSLDSEGAIPAGCLYEIAP